MFIRLLVLLLPSLAYAQIMQFAGSSVIASIPSSCRAGQFWWATDAAANANLYACNSVDLKYYVVSGGGAQLGTGIFSCVRNSGTLATCASGCTSDAPCTSTFGLGTTATTCTITSAMTATLTGPNPGTDNLFIYWTESSGSCTLNVGTSTQGVTCSGCTAVTGVTAFPANSIQLWSFNTTSGNYNAGSGTNNQKPSNNKEVIASGTLALATSAISSATCTSAQTASAGGTKTTDTVIASFNGDPTGVTGYSPSTDGMLVIIIYPTANTFNAKVCNNTVNSITPGAITLNWSVIRQ